ncbi:hypothetical protein K504DRAFT_508559 [Pleomassaria siparia CBS 279.74]|uniref:Uncharacterized protein n=1 Tax=Pleomassaria siparia CBS 279.74 TaxID=1314801 RepID=A0A6G1JRT3_9PLEO|nr:hypothetical protein K504DRAFT_508559 [Pleomassaria siparia CBS 279.74]
MFLSVKERARQIASGQFQASDAPPPPAPVVEPATPSKKKTPGRIVTTKFSPPKAPSAPSPTSPSKLKKDKTPTSSKPTPSPSTPAKTPSSRKTASAKPESPKLAPPKTTSSKASSSKTETPKTPKSPKSPKTPSTKTASSKPSSSKPKASKPSSPKPTPSKPKSAPAPSKPARPTPARIGSFTADPSEDNTEVSDLKARCLKHANSVTGLGGRKLAVVLKQTSSGGWYAALKDVGLDKYLKMWMNRDKTFPTQVEALEAYLVFIKKMKVETRLFS